MSANQPTDQSTPSTKDKVEPHKPAHLDASSAGSLDRNALHIIKTVNAAANVESLHHVELTDSSKPAAAAKTPTEAFDAAKLKVLEDDAKAIRKATGNDNLIARWADKDGINKILEGKSDAERKTIDDFYKKDFKISLDTEVGKFEHGADLDKFKDILHRQDGNAENENARRIHEDLLEHKNLFSGRSNSEIEKDILDTLSSHNSEQLTKMNAEYKAAYGQTLSDALGNDPKLSQVTKDISKVYLDHTRETPSQENSKLIDLALKSKNEERFAEVMKNASPEDRKEFLANGGQKKIQDAFGHWYSDADTRHAMDYAQEGKLDAATQIKDNTHLFNNSKGIELAIQQMTDDERKMYENGKSLSTGGKVKNLSAEDSKKAEGYYAKLHGALTAAGNATEVAQNEAKIDTRNGEGSLISNLAEHRGLLWNDSENKIDNDIRNMSQKDWDDNKNNPERREQLKTMLGTLNKKPEEVNKTLAIYDKMISADTFATASEKGKVSVLSSLDNSNHWYGTNQKQAMDSIANMSPSDQSRYRSDAGFRKQVDDAVGNKIEDPAGQDAIKRMLESVKAGKSPNDDAIANLERIQNFDGSKSGDVVAAVEKAFKDDPSLKARLSNPQTDDDRKVAQQFKTAAQNAFGDDYDLLGKPLIETGHLPIENRLALNRGLFSDNYEQINSDLKDITANERQRLLTDPQYRKTTIGFMSSERQKVAMAVIAQGDEKSEDKVRAATIGWGGSDDIVSTLKGLNPEELEQAKDEYSRKYGTSMEGDLTHKLTGKDRTEAERIFTQNLSVESRVNIARDQTENARSGFGAAVSDKVWRSGTGAQADNALDQTNQALTEKNMMDKAIANGADLAGKMSPEEQQALQQKMMATINERIKFQQDATDNHSVAKAEAAQYVGDGAIAAVAIGSMIVTGGADAPLVIGLAAAGAGIKVGTNAVLEGNDYDWSLSNVATDAAIGSVTAATSVIGPGEIASVFGIGTQAAEGASAAALTGIEAGALKDGGEALLADGTKTIVRDALASGAKTLDEKAFTALAEKVIAPELEGAARDEAVSALAASLQQEVTNRMATGIVRTFAQQGLNMAGSAVGGGAGGTVQGVSEWDSRNSVLTNAGHVLNQTLDGSVSGAIGGGIMSVGMEGIGDGLQLAHTAFASSETLGRLGSFLTSDATLDVAGRAVEGDSKDVLKVAAGTAFVEGTFTIANDAVQNASQKAAREAAAQMAALHNNGFTLDKGLNYKARVQASVSSDASQYDGQQAKAHKAAAEQETPTEQSTRVSTARTKDAKKADTRLEHSL